MNTRYAIQVMLQITHPDADLSEVPKRLGLKANYSKNKGDPISGIKGDTSDVDTCKWSVCNMLAVENAESLSVALSKSVETIRPHRDFLIDISDRGAKLILFVGCGFDAEADYFYDLLEWPLFKDLSDLRISLDFTACDRGYEDRN